MVVIGRGAELRVLAEEIVVVVKNKPVAGDGFHHTRIAEHEALVGIGQIARGRHQHRDLGLGSGRAHEEHQMIFDLARTQARRVHAALQTGRHGPSESRLPAAVDDRVVVEIDAAELLGREAKAVVLTPPVEAGHGAHRTVVALTMQAVGAEVDDTIADTLRGISGAGVPIGDAAGRERRVALAQPRKLRQTQCAGLYTRPVELAVEQATHAAAVAGLVVVVTGQQQIGVRSRRSQGQCARRSRAVIEFQYRAQVTVVGVDHRLLIELDRATLGVIGRSNEIPDLRHERPLARHFVHRLAVAGPEAQAAGIVQPQAIATTRRRIELGDQTLATLAGGGGPHEGVHRETAGRQQPTARVSDLHETAGLGELGRERDLTIHVGREFMLDEARAVGRDVTVQYAHQLRLSARHARRADHELHGLTRAHAQTVAITGNKRLDHYFAPAPRMRSSRWRRNTACKASF